MKHKSEHHPKPVFAMSLLLMISAMLFSTTSMAGDQPEMIIDLETAEFHIEQLDISGLETGDVETIYTEDGKTIDVVRTDTGVDIFVDGEKLDLPGPGVHTMHADSHEARHVIVQIECESDADEDCAAQEHWSMNTAVHPDDGEAIYHKIIIRDESHSADEI